MSEAPSTQLPTQAAAPSAQKFRRLGNFEQAAQEQGCTSRTLRNHLANGVFKAYRMRGVRGVLLDLDEVELAMRYMPRRYWAGRARYGPKAVIEDLPPQPVIVNDRVAR